MSESSPTTALPRLLAAGPRLWPRRGGWRSRSTPTTSGRAAKSTSPGLASSGRSLLDGPTRATGRGAGLIGARKAPPVRHRRAMADGGED